MQVHDISVSIMKKNLNSLFCMLICIWISLPFVTYMTGTLFFIVMFACWLVTTDLKWLLQRYTGDLIFIVLFFVSFLPYILTGTLQYGSNGATGILINMPIFFTGCLFFHYYIYYKKDYKMVKKIVLVTILAFLIGAIQTYNALLDYPLASRELAGVAFKNPELAYTYMNLGIGGYGFVYGATFLCLGMIIVFLYGRRLMQRKVQLFWLISILILIFVILKASYSIALMLLLLGICLGKVLKFKNGLYYLILAFVSITIMTFTILDEILLFVANKIGTNPTVQEKVFDLYNFLSMNGSGKQTEYRFELYTTSIETFLKNPLFGMYGPNGNIMPVGGHSGWLDMLAYYGLFNFIIIIMIFILFLRKVRFIYKNDLLSMRLINISFAVFFVFGILNPNLTVFEAGLVLFFIIPSMPIFFKKDQIAEL